MTKKDFLLVSSLFYSYQNACYSPTTSHSILLACTNVSL